MAGMCGDEGGRRQWGGHSPLAAIDPAAEERGAERSHQAPAQAKWDITSWLVGDPAAAPGRTLDKSTKASFSTMETSTVIPRQLQRPMS